MLSFRRAFLVLLGALLVAVSACSTSVAAPITVNLRVEGSTSTIFEGAVSTEAPAAPGIATKSSEGTHLCDFSHNGTHEGFPAIGPTPTAALYDAATANGLTFDAKWSKSLNDFFITQVGSDIQGGAPEFPAWGYAVNYTTAEVGGCQFLLAAGSEVLWAYNFFNLPHLLKLSGPATASVGAQFTLQVADGQTGEPISGAAIGELVAGVTTAIPSSGVTDATGNASVSLPHAGRVTLKATAGKSVRSNGVVVCVHNGSDGTCGTTVPTKGVGPVQTHTAAPPFEGDLARITGIKNEGAYRRRFAPRELSGTVEIRTGGTLRQVRIGLQRRYRGRCFEFSGRKVRFVRVRRCGTLRLFPIGSAQSFSYLLPAPLPPGRYVFEMQAVEDSGHPTRLLDGTSRVAFLVR
jgi:hypothetical protein